MELAKAYVQIVPSADGIKGNLEKAIGGESAAAGSSAGALLGNNLVSMLKKVVVAAGIGKIIHSSLEAGGALQQSFGGLDTIYGEAAEAAKKYASEAAKAGISANSYAEQAVSFGASLKMAFGGDTTKAVEAANVAIMDMADNAAKMGTPLENIQNAYQGFAKQNYTMLDNLKLGYGGTKQEMERLLADAQKLTGVKYDISNLGDVYDAIHVIQGELGLTGVAAQEASETFSGSLEAVKASWNNVLAYITTGQDITKPLWTLFDNIFTFVQGNLMPMLGNIFRGLPDLLSQALGYAIRTLNGIAYNMPELIDTGIEIVGGIANAILGALPYLAQSALDIITTLGSYLLSGDWVSVATGIISDFSDNMHQAALEILGTDTNIIETIVSSITKDLPEMVATAGVTITNFVSGLLDYLPKVFDSASQIISSLVKGVTTALPRIITVAGQVMQAYLNTVLSKLPDVLASAVKMIVTMVQGITQSLPRIAEASTNVMKKLVSTLLAHAPEILQAGIKLIFELASGIIRSLPDIISAAFKIVGGILDTIHNIDWLSLGVSIVTGIIQGLWSMAGALWDAMKSLASNAFGAVKDFFGISSPSKLMADKIGAMIPAGIAEGIEDNAGVLRAAMDDVAAEATASYNADFMMRGNVAAQQTMPAINYGGVTINVTADSVQQSRDFVDWLEGQLTQRTQNRRTAALA